MSGNQDKTSGYIAMHVPTANALVELNKSKQIATAQYNNNLELAKQKAALGGGGSNPFYSVELDPSVDINQ
jgi:hypothetical protein